MTSKVTVTSSRAPYASVPLTVSRQMPFQLGTASNITCHSPRVFVDAVAFMSGVDVNAVKAMSATVPSGSSKNEARSSPTGDGTSASSRKEWGGRARATGGLFADTVTPIEQRADSSPSLTVMATGTVVPSRLLGNMRDNEVSMTAMYALSVVRESVSIWSSTSVKYGLRSKLYLSSYLTARSGTPSSDGGWLTWITSTVMTSSHLAPWSFSAVKMT